MFMFWGSDTFPYYDGAKVASGPDEQGYYKTVDDLPGHRGRKPLYLCSDAEGGALMNRRGSMRKEFEVLQNNLHALCNERLQTLPPELRT